MKRIIRLGAAVTAALTLGACSQDETAGGGDGTRRPMELTATGLQTMAAPATRATADGDWTGVTAVAVKVGTEVKSYAVTTDGAAAGAQARLTCAAEPFYWPASGGVTVSAWWPYDGADITTKPAVEVMADQSHEEDYAASDFIEAVGQPVTQDNNALEFKHRTAKICVDLKNADGAALAGAAVSIAAGGQTVKCLEKANDDNSVSYLALIAPVEQQQELKVMITANGRNYVYKHAALQYDANSQYTFRLKVQRVDVVALEGCTISDWNYNVLVNDGVAEEENLGFTKDADGTYHVTSAAGLEAWAKAVASSANNNVFCVLENDIVMPAVADGESNWTPISEFAGIFDGNGKTIKGLVVNKGAESDAGFIGNNNGTVMNLTLEKAEITAGGGVIGAVAGINQGTIKNCHVTGASVIEAESGNIVGGVAGTNSNTILACHVAKDCKVSGTSQVGGIAGNNNGQITGCYALCSLKGTDCIGGICGRINIGLTACYSKCSYSSGNKIGGIVGENVGLSANFYACYWQETENCGNGVGSGMNDNPSGVTKIGGETTWDTACGEMNKKLTGYKYEVGTSADEPLVLQAVTNK